MTQTIILGIDGHPLGALLSTNAAEAIPQVRHSPSGVTGGFALGSATEGSVRTIGAGVLRCGAFQSDALLSWVAATARRLVIRKTVTLTVVDRARQSAAEAELFDCLVTEVSLPACDAVRRTPRSCGLPSGPSRSGSRPPRACAAGPRRRR